MVERIAPERQQLILEMRSLGYTQAAIAQHVGCGLSTVKRVIASGVADLTPTDKVAELMSQEKTTAEIAAELGITRDAVKSAYKRIKRALGPQAR